MEFRQDRQPVVIFLMSSLYEVLQMTIFLLEEILPDAFNYVSPLNPKDLPCIPSPRWLVRDLNVALIRQLVKHIKNARLLP